MKANINNRYKIWQSIRIMRRFYTTDVIMTTEARMITVRQYLNVLKRFGYIKVIKRGCRNGASVSTSWLLLKNTGPHEPRYNQRTKRLFDNNEKKYISETG